MPEEKDITNATDALGKALQWISSPRGGNNFYGRVLNGCDRRDQTGLGTCGLTIDLKGRYVFLWDPEWFVEQDEPLQQLVMVHEAGHLVLKHMERTLWQFREYSPQLQQHLLPVRRISNDMAVNDVALRPMMGDKNLRFVEYRDQIVWPESPQFKFPVGKTADEYFLLLIEKLKADGWSPTPPPPGEEMVHPNWFEDALKGAHPPLGWMDDFKAASVAQIERAVRRAARETRFIVQRAIRQTEKHQGTVPAELSSYIDNILDEPTVPWPMVMRGLIKSEISSTLQNSMVLPSLTLLECDDLEPYPGFENDYAFNIIAAFDTSGSMSDDEVTEAYNELKGILQTEGEVTVRMVHFDAKIQHEETLTQDSVSELQKGKLARHGRGGTDFSPPLRYILGIDTPDDWVGSASREKRRLEHIDLALLFTDGGASIPFPKLEPQIPFFWVLSTHGHEDEKMRRILHIT